MGMEVTPITRNGEQTGSVYRNRNESGKIHDEHGPAVSVIEPGKPDVHEWWRNGSLIATYQNGELKKSTNGEYSGLQEAILPEKWKNHVGSLDLSDISLCNLKEPVMSGPTVESVKSRISSIRANAQEPSTTNSLKNKF